MEGRAEYHLPAVEVFTDYSQWERRPSTKPGARAGNGRAKTTSSRRQDALSLAARLSQESVIVDQAPQQPQVGPPHSHCHHFSSSSKKLPCVKKISNKALSPRRKIEKAQLSPLKLGYSLQQMQLETRRKSVRDFKKYKDDLLAANLMLIGDIRKDEDEKNCAVQEMLDKYRKSRGSVAALKKKTHRDKMEAQAELERTKEWVLQKEKELHEEVREAELLLQAKVKERDILKSFKEKKFRVNQSTIEQLKDEIKTQAHQSEESVAVLEGEMDDERGKCQRMMDGLRRDIEAQATEKCIKMMKRSVKEKGIQNKIMEKEIELHRYKAETMRQLIEKLKENIRVLKAAIMEDKARARPLVLVEKCLPDTELHLNITLQDS